MQELIMYAISILDLVFYNGVRSSAGGNSETHEMDFGLERAIEELN